MTIKNFTTGAKFNYGLFFTITSLLSMVGIFLYPNCTLASDIDSQKIIKLTNQKRQENNLNPLITNRYLTQAAHKKAEFLLKNQLFRHNVGDKKFSKWIRETGYKYSYAGENLAIDFTTDQDVIQAWMNSPTHKKNLLYPDYKEIGVAVVSGRYQGHDSTLVVQIFSTPASAHIEATSPGSPSSSPGASPEINSETANSITKNSNSSVLNTGIKPSLFKNYPRAPLEKPIEITLLGIAVSLLILLVYLLFPVRPIKHRR